MGRAKRWIAAITAVSLAAFGGYKGLSWLKEKNAPKVTVVDIAELITEDYDDYGYYDSPLSGSIALNVTQNIRIDKDVIVGELLVNVGDEVKQGDLLMTIDTTLPEMELGLQDLKLQQMRLDLEKASNRLYSLQHGGPIEEKTEDSGIDSSDDTGSGDTVIIENPGSTSLEGDYTQEGDYLIGMNTREGVPAYLAAAMPLLGFFVKEKPVPEGNVAELAVEENVSGQTAAEGAADLGSDLTENNTGITDTIEPGDGYETVPGEEATDITVPEEVILPADDTGELSLEEETTPGEGTGDITEIFPEEMDSGNELVVEDAPSDELIVDADSMLTPTPALSPTPSPGVHPDRVPTVSDLLTGETELYQVLDYYADPVYGEGTNEDPFVFLCSSLEGSVIMKGSFLNLMAGYNYDGSKTLHEGGYWFMLVFFENDILPDPAEEEPDLSGMTFITYNGGADFETPLDPEYEEEVFVEEADEYVAEEEAVEEEYRIEDYGEETASGTGLTRDEAIKEQEQRIKDLEHSIKQGEKELTRLQKRCEIKEIRSRLDGTVSYTGNPDSGTSSLDSFLKVKSKEGYYVAGQVSEMMLDQISPGTVVTCTTDMGETFDAEVIDVSIYPEKSDVSSDFGSGNPNASVYGFTASIAQQDLNISEDTWLISVTLPQTETEESNGITLNKAFVRSENGRSYVMKEENGVLVKQYVRVGKVDAYGYSITITGGLRRDDKLAFPYSEDAVEGTKTVTGTLEDLYDYSDMMF